MTFQEDKLEDFFSIFHSVRDQIAAFPGCHEVKIYSDVEDKTVIFTYSEWSSIEHLTQYRNSVLFTKTWNQTKKLFKAGPEAWSVKKINP